jgi:hypothetical protein
MNKRKISVKVVCTCGHFGVDRGEKGTVIKMVEGGFVPVVKWDNGYTERIEWDFVEIYNHHL